MSALMMERLSQRLRVQKRQWEDLNRIAESLTDVVQLNRGNPDLPAAPHVIAAAHKALDEGRTRYTHWQGIPELRRAIAAKLSRDNRLAYEPDEIIVTAGSQEALFVTVMALTDPGDDIVMPDPHYMTFGRALAVAGGQFVPVPTQEHDGFVVHAADVERRLTPRTKMLVVSSPHNPTGTVLDEPVLRDLADVARRANLLVMSDEIYEKLLFDSAHHVSIAAFPGMRDRTVVINGFSKAYCMTGFRVGYLAAPRPVVEAMEVLKADVSICSSSISQWAALAALEGPQDDLADKLRIYDERRQIIMRALDEMRIRYVRPRGAMYVFANITATGMNSVQFCERMLRESRVLVSPGTAFGAAGEGYVRIAWLVPTEQVRRGMERMHEFVDRHTRGPVSEPHLPERKSR
jgi:aminotransferase